MIQIYTSLTRRARTLYWIGGRFRKLGNWFVRLSGVERIRGKRLLTKRPDYFIIDDLEETKK